MDQVKIGNFLKKLRKEKGITQEQLAEILNVSGRTVSRWETGNNMPDISILVDIADYYDISIPEIISGERKSEMMNEEERIIAKTMSDYATTEKEKILMVLPSERLLLATPTRQSKPSQSKAPESDGESPLVLMCSKK